MSILKDFHDTERELARQLLLLESLSKNTDLKKELEFEKKLKALITRYCKTTKEVISLLDSWVPSSRSTVHEDTSSYMPKAKQRERSRKKPDPVAR